MAYIGKEPQVGNYSVLDALSASSTASYTMQLSSTNFTPESANHLIVSLNGVIQKPGSSYTVSGSTITFSSTLSSSDSIDFIIALGNVLDIGVPSDGVISNAKLGTDLISGETDIGGAIADADLFLVDDGAGGTLRKTAASRIKTYIGGGITQAQQWRITSGFTFSTVQDIDSNWEISDATGYGSIGSNLTQSSGIFTFPSTGYYLIMATFNFRRATNERGVGGNINATTNNSSYSVVSSVEVNNSDVGGGDNTTYAGSCQAIFDVTDTSNIKFKLTIQTSASDQTCDGDTSRNYTGFVCVRLGDT